MGDSPLSLPVPPVFFTINIKNLFLILYFLVSISHALRSQSLTPGSQMTYTDKAKALPSQQAGPGQMLSALLWEVAMQSPELWGNLMGTESAILSSQLQNKCQIFKHQPQVLLPFFSQEPPTKHLTIRRAMKTRSSAGTPRPSTSPGCISGQRSFQMAQNGRPRAFLVLLEVLEFLLLTPKWVHTTPEIPAHKTKCDSVTPQGPRVLDLPTSKAIA